MWNISWNSITQIEFSTQHANLARFMRVVQSGPTRMDDITKNLLKDIQVQFQDLESNNVLSTVDVLREKNNHW